MTEENEANKGNYEACAFPPPPLSIAIAVPLTQTARRSRRTVVSSLPSWGNSARTSQQ